MMADKAPCLEPEEVLNDWTSPADAERDRCFTIQEFWVRCTLGRMDAATLWDRKPRTGESNYRSFYAGTDYFVLRQMYHSHNECHDVLADPMRSAGAAGDFCEYDRRVVPLRADASGQVYARYVKPR